MGCPYCGEGAEWDVHTAGRGLSGMSILRGGAEWDVHTAWRGLSGMSILRGDKLLHKYH